jgi:hypothetical protein
MSGRWLPVAVLVVGSLLVLARAGGRAQDPAEAPANRENIEAALRLTQAAAADYEIRLAGDEKPLQLQREPVLRWSNPARGEIHGNVFLWTRDGRPYVVASLHKWFTPHKHMSHEFQSLAEVPLGAAFHGEPVWKTSGPGLRFQDVPQAAAPAANEAQRLLQLKQLAREFSGSKRERREDEVELRLLPQPVHRYTAPKQGILNGALFALVQGTDPEIFLLIEARGEDVARARWQFAATRMTSVEWRLRHRDRQVCAEEALPWSEVYDHQHVYTNFLFHEIPDFLKDALNKPKP